MKLISAFFGSFGIFLMFMAGYIFFFRPSHVTIFQNSMDVWDPANPKGAFFFNFSSQGAIAAGRPVHVKVTFFITQGLNISDMLPLSIILPDSYAYPLKPDPQGVTYSAGDVEIKPVINGPATGEIDVIFPQSGKFGYIIFSKSTPVWVTSMEPFFYSIVEVEPANVGIFLASFESFLAVSLLELGIFLEVMVFRRHIELIAGRKRPVSKTRVGIYLL